MSDQKEDVKQEEAKADEKAKATNEEVSEASADEKEEEELYETIMGNKENKIPYSRFKEVNDAKKAAEAKIAELEAGISARVDQAVKDKLIEQQLLNKPEIEEDYSFLDPDSGTKQEVEALKQQISELAAQVQGVSQYTEENILKQELKNLKAIFPAMNEEHVLAAKKLSPNTSLEEIAKYSNDMFNNHAKKVFNEMIEQKKKAAETAKVVKKEAIKALPPEEKPKTMAEARKIMMQFMDED
jgi:hypothetical protein